MNEIRRVVVWFSAGVTSAIAAKIAVDQYRGILPVHLVNCDTGSEDDDNRRFMEDVSKWLDVPLEIIHNPKYTDTFDVYEKTRYLVGTAGARCTLELKKVPRRRYEDLEGDLQVFGFDANEGDRGGEFLLNNPEIRAWFPLIERGITKTDARQILLQNDIAEPVTYSMGFNNANCLKRGCVKGGMGYWNHIRRVRRDGLLEPYQAGEAGSVLEHGANGAQNRPRHLQHRNGRGRETGKASGIPGRVITRRREL